VDIWLVFGRDLDGNESRGHLKMSRAELLVEANTGGGLTNLDRPCVQGFLEGLQRWELLSEMQGRHCMILGMMDYLGYGAKLRMGCEA
jgi:hypothetical protein